ncbi:MAG: hypothetical protein GXZ09_08130 [Syntrophomonadaceae bacterium]|nr:hypothetical protein [Syntrophomonadaceae bacterium]
MFIVASFDYSLYPELAVTELIEKGLKNEQILAFPMELSIEPRQILDTNHHSDSISMTDFGFILGTAFMILGVIYGFVWKWGPIIWGLIGLVGGFFLGCTLDYLYGKIRRFKCLRKPITELIIMIDCQEDQVEMVKQTLQGHFALGISILP